MDYQLRSDWLGNHLTSGDVYLHSGVYTTFGYSSFSRQRREVHVKRVIEQGCAFGLSISESVLWGTLLQFCRDYLEDGRQFRVRIALFGEGFQLDAREFCPRPRSLRGRLFACTRNRPELKTLEYAVPQVENQKDGEGVEALLLTPDGRVTEGVRSNLLCYSENRVLIPDQQCLSGLGVQYLIPLLQRAFIIEAGALSVQRLLESDEILVVSDLQGVCWLDGILERSWKPKGRILVDYLESQLSPALRWW